LIATTTLFARLIGALKPKYLAVALDAGRTTFRKHLYPRYKAHRQETPAELVVQLKLIAPVLEALGARCYVSEGFEADDVMASLTVWARERGMNAVMVSEDKDMLQLIGTGVHVLKSVFEVDLQLIGDDDVLTKYGVRAAQLVDYFALVGDSADNIPGVRSVGPVIAKALVNHFGTVDNIYRMMGSDSDAFDTALQTCMALAKEEGKRGASPARVRKLLEASTRDEVMLFRELVSLRSDVTAIAPACTKRLEAEGVLSLATLSTGHFRYIGEAPSAEKDLNSMSRDLGSALSSLRRNYHTLDRIL
jgi:5'-3' exonuclease